MSGSKHTRLYIGDWKQPAAQAEKTRPVIPEPGMFVCSSRNQAN